MALTVNAGNAFSAEGTSTRSERFSLFIGGERVGRMVAVDTLTPDGHIELRRESELALSRGDVEVRISSISTTVLDKNLRPIRFDFKREEPGGKMHGQGLVKGQVVELRTDAGGASNSRTVELGPDTTFAAALEYKSRLKLQAGERFKGKVLLEELGALVDAEYVVKRTAEGFLISGKVANIEQREYLDHKGKTIRLEIPALGAYAVPEGAEPKPVAGTLDILARTVWKAPVDMAHRNKLSRVTFRVDGQLAGPIPQDRHQKLLLKRSDHQIVQNRRQARGKIEILSAQEKKKFLAATPYEPIGDSRIVAAAKKAIKGAKNPAERVAALTRFVYERVEEKDLSRAYAPATTTLESGVGDCTEHSVLFSALAKASGIPTRLVDGVVVADGNIGYHEWVEVYLDGEGWRAVDPTFGEAIANPNRLKLATGTSQPEDLLKMGLSAASALTGLKVSVIAHE